MEAEFVNDYIEQLNKKLHDLTSQLVLSETRVGHLSKQLTAATTELEKTRDALAKATSRPKKVTEKDVDF